MKKYSKLIIGSILMFLFVLLTILLKFVDVQKIGPNVVEVGFAELNHIFVNLIDYNETLFKIADYMILAAFPVAGIFVVLGIVQWVKRKNILKVDHQVLTLGVCYAVVISIYVLFLFVTINERPYGEPESSYPSSHAMVALFVFLSAIYMAKYLLANHKKLAIASYIVLILLAGFTLFGRLLSGAHWFTDILGGCLLSAGLLYIFIFFCEFIGEKKKASKDEENQTL